MIAHPREKINPLQAFVTKLKNKPAMAGEGPYCFQTVRKDEKFPANPIIFWQERQSAGAVTLQEAGSYYNSPGRTKKRPGPCYIGVIFQEKNAVPPPRGTAFDLPYYIIYNRDAPRLRGTGVCVRASAVSPPTGGGSVAPRSCERGAAMMVTYSDLIQIGILIVGIIGLFLSHKTK